MELPSIDDIRQLESRDIGSWPLQYRIGVVIAAAIVSIFLMYTFVISDQFDTLERERQNQATKRKDFEEKYDMAANLDAYKAQMVQVQDSYKEILKQLPDSSQIPGLLDSISTLAEQDNLTFQSIKLGTAKSVLGFYKELPIDIAVIGGYHDFGKFIGDLSKLPRIVTLHDFLIKPVNTKQANGDELSMVITAKTYWLSIEAPPPPKGEGPAKGNTPGAKTKPGATQPNRGPARGRPNNPNNPTNQNLPTAAFPEAPTRTTPGGPP